MVLGHALHYFPKLPPLGEWLRRKRVRHGINFDVFEDNLQTRWLCGWACNEKADLNETDLELAKDRLLRFNVVLRLENLSVSILRMAAFGWTQLTDVSHNPRRRVPSPEIRDFLKQRQQWDLQLYAFAGTLPQR